MTQSEGTAASASVLSGRRILLGVTGSIAAYKAVELASRLTQAGALVDVLLSRSAERFVASMTFHSVTRRPCYTGADLWGEQSHVLHVELGRTADILAVAPATAHTIAKLAHGEADNLISLAALTLRGPLLIAPAMDAGMYHHPAVQDNLHVLQSRGAIIAGPAEGRMASGLIGEGRLLEPDAIVGHIRLALGAGGPLAGTRFVVTAGGTREPIDPVRSIANRASGKQGFALAQAALDRGAKVILITGPSHLPAPVGAERIDVTTGDEMAQAVEDALNGADGLIMAAAVSDFRPLAPAESKIKKAGGIPKIELERTVDILGRIGAERDGLRRPVVLVGFAAETEDLVENARTKLQEKGLDLIVANDISQADSGFGTDTNQVTMLEADGSVQVLPLLSKAGVAERVLDRVAELLSDATAS
jgi:phosphopantothenoylcysteine decarboxylase/phosphopantothenate--cysteine ligase